MSEAWDEGGERKGRPRRRRRKRGDPPPTPEERAYREARNRANAKLGFIFHFIPYAFVCLFLLFVAGFRAAFIVATMWGIGVACHWFAAVVAPGLRKRLIEEEVQREVAHSVPAERRNLEDKHARSLEQLSASIAHEIRNPITAAKSLVQQMGEDPASRDSVGYAKVALDELDRVERSISHLLRYAREQEVQVADVRLAEIIDSALATFRERIDRSDVLLVRELDTEGRMRGDPEQLRRVVINLVGNALDALEGTPEPELSVQAGENLAGTELWVRVRDNGPGIDPETAGKIFSPFYTSKPGGTGLGLALARKAVEAHGGAIEMRTPPEGGCEFLLTFPRQAGGEG